MAYHSLLRDPTLECEHRDWVAYDDVSPGHLVMPNGSLVAALDRTFMSLAARLVLDLHLRLRED